jgi:hypothetical protein
MAAAIFSCIVLWDICIKLIFILDCIVALSIEQIHQLSGFIKLTPGRLV